MEKSALRPARNEDRRSGSLLTGFAFSSLAMKMANTEPSGILFREKYIVYIWQIAFISHAGVRKKLRDSVGTAPPSNGRGEE